SRALGSDRAARGDDAAAASVLDDEIQDLAVLDDVEAETARRARIAPGDGIMPGGAAARLPGAAIDREAGVRAEIVDRHDAAHILDGIKLAVDTVDLDGVDGPRRGFHRRFTVRKREDT